jgi:CRISPR-associated protein Cas2
MDWIICYDIASNRRRSKVAKILLDHGDRLQESVYLCRMPEARMAELRGRIASKIDPKTDAVGIFRRCAACRPAGSELGRPREIETPRATVHG